MNLSDQLNSGIDRISNGTAVVAARFTQALRHGWSPNKILAVTKDMTPEQQAWSKRILDICLAEHKNWP